MEAGRLADDLIFEPGFVRGGPATISNETWDDQLFHMLNRNSVTGETEPECWLYHQANFMLRLVPPGTRIGEDIDFFVLPPIDPDQPTPSIGGGLFASALVDRPEVRAFMEFMASPEWGERWAADADSGFVSANRRFDTVGLRRREPRIPQRQSDSRWRPRSRPRSMPVCGDTTPRI